MLRGRAPWEPFANDGISPGDQVYTARPLVATSLTGQDAIDYIAANYLSPRYGFVPIESRMANTIGVGYSIQSLATNVVERSFAITGRLSYDKVTWDGSNYVAVPYWMESEVETDYRDGKLNYWRRDISTYSAAWSWFEKTVAEDGADTTIDNTVTDPYNLPNPDAYEIGDLDVTDRITDGDAHEVVSASITVTATSYEWEIVLKHNLNDGFDGYLEITYAGEATLSATRSLSQQIGVAKDLADTGDFDDIESTEQGFHIEWSRQAGVGMVATQQAVAVDTDYSYYIKNSDLEDVPTGISTPDDHALSGCYSSLVDRGSLDIEFLVITPRLLGADILWAKEEWRLPTSWSTNTDPFPAFTYDLEFSSTTPYRGDFANVLCTSDLISHTVVLEPPIDSFGGIAGNFDIDACP